MQNLIFCFVLQEAIRHSEFQCRCVGGFGWFDGVGSFGGVGVGSVGSVAVDLVDSVDLMFTLGWAVLRGDSIEKVSLRAVELRA